VIKSTKLTSRQKNAEICSYALQVGDPNLGDRKEVWISGRHIMMGYLNREDSTAKVS